MQARYQLRYGPYYDNIDILFRLRCNRWPAIRSRKQVVNEQAPGWAVPSYAKATEGILRLREGWWTLAGSNR